MHSWGQFFYLIVMMLIALVGAHFLLRFGQGELTDDIDRWRAEVRAKVDTARTLMSEVVGAVRALNEEAPAGDPAGALEADRR